MDSGGRLDMFWALILVIGEREVIEGREKMVIGMFLGIYMLAGSTGELGS